MKCPKCGNPTLKTPSKMARGDKLCKDCFNGRRERWRKEKPKMLAAQRAKHSKKYKLLQAHKMKARAEVIKAIRAGKLKRPAGDGWEAHHLDYANPLKIRWVQKKDHMKSHHSKYE